MKKPPLEVKLISLLLFIYPLIVFVCYSVLSQEKNLWEMMSAFRWSGFFILYGILGYGVWKLNWKIRLAVIAFSVAGVVGPLAGIILAPLVNLDLFFKVLKMHGATVVIWEPLFMFVQTFGISIIYLSFILYKLTRPEIKEQFQKEPI